MRNHRINTGIVSIILPTHNRSDILEQALNSVIQQTYTNWELFIIADACTDNTANILTPYLNNPKITFIQTKTSLGGGGARNLGLKKIKGEFIAFLDDDDIWDCKKVENQVNFLNKNKDINLCYCNFNQWLQDGSLKEITLPTRTTLENLLIMNYIGSFSFVMIRYNESLINPALKSCQDWDLWVKTLTKSTNKTAYNINKTLVNYRIQGQKKISTNKNAINTGYKTWYTDSKHLMNKRLINFHETIIFLKENNSLLKALLKSIIFITKHTFSLKYHRIIVFHLLDKYGL